MANRKRVIHCTENYRWSNTNPTKDLAKPDKRVNHDEAEIFEEFVRQSNRHYSKLDISSLVYVYTFLAGKAADTINKAISKCLRETTR